MVGHLLGFGREVSTAYYFGTSGIADGILVGIIPLTLYASVFGTAYANAAIVHIKEPSNLQAIRNCSTPLLLLAIFTGAFFLCFAEPLVALMAPGINEQGREVAIAFVQLSSIGMALASLSFLGRGILHLEQRFARASISDLMPNLGAITGIVVLYHWLGVYGLALGALVGYFLQFWVVSNPSHFAINRRSFQSLLSEEQKAIYRSTLMAAVSYSVVYIDVLVDRYFASQLAEGAVATMNYAQKIMLLPLYTVIFAITTVLFPKLIALQDNPEAFHRLKRKTYGVVLGSSVAISIFTIFAAEFIIELVFGYGQFTQQDVQATSQVLMIYMLGLTGHAFVLMASRVRYAMKDFRTPLIAGVVGAFVNLGLDILLVDEYGMTGLAMATTISAFVNGLILVARPYGKPV
ncbi:lipid II flippase MurJ [Paraferrimonas sedimenticola]|nr:lipid II flippase MurJ [Paraferrimonas sedimenticola]